MLSASLFTNNGSDHTTTHSITHLISISANNSANNSANYLVTSNTAKLLSLLQNTNSDYGVSKGQLLSSFQLTSNLFVMTLSAA